jgi:hypothetical protein
MGQLDSTAYSPTVYVIFRDPPGHSGTQVDPFKCANLETKKYILSGSRVGLSSPNQAALSSSAHGSSSEFNSCCNSCSATVRLSPPGGHFGRGVVGRMQSPSDSAYMRLSRPPRTRVALSRVCQIGHMDHTARHQLNRDLRAITSRETCQPYRRPREGWGSTARRSWARGVASCHSISCRRVRGRGPYGLSSTGVLTTRPTSCTALTPGLSLRLVFLSYTHGPSSQKIVWRCPPPVERVLEPKCGKEKNEYCCGEESAEQPYRRDSPTCECAVCLRPRCPAPPATL